MLELIKALAIEAGEMMLAGAEQGIHTESKPGVGNYVTEWDRRIEVFLRNELIQLLPQARFVGEECSHETTNAVGLKIIVDPIDGTANYIRGARYSAVSIGIVDADGSLMGIVYNPFTGECFSAERGKGAWRGSERIHAANRVLSASVIGFGTPVSSRQHTKQIFAILRGVYDRVEDIRNYGSAALDICHTACGMLDGFMELELQPWDYAGAMCVLMEAGGIITRMDGRALTFDCAQSVLAASRTIHAPLLDIVASQTSIVHENNPQK